MNVAVCAKCGEPMTGPNHTCSGMAIARNLGLVVGTPVPMKRDMVTLVGKRYTLVPRTDGLPGFNTVRVVLGS